MGFMDRVKDQVEDLSKKARPKVDELREKAGPEGRGTAEGKWTSCEKAKPLAEKAGTPRPRRPPRPRNRPRASARGGRKSAGGDKHDGGPTPPPTAGPTP